ncbi:glycosyl hydrolase family 61-domain-containing protein [Tirmania nivea]|nr:glycosyl hydrolase family 61-domain-containing protein [Tirmania nivea]
MKASVLLSFVLTAFSINGVDQGQLKGDSTIINTPAGAWWGHVIGGAQVPNDPENPIASSHKGPSFAKVSNAATAGTTGLQWFKIAEDGFDGSKWAVDCMIAGAGWNYFTMPSCIAPGNYLMRVELITLNSAYSAGGAQFYISSGTSSGANFVSFSGTYKSSDPGITINIYGSVSGQPDMGGKPYTIPRPPVLDSSSTGSATPHH